MDWTNTKAEWNGEDWIFTDAPLGASPNWGGRTCFSKSELNYEGADPKVALAALQYWVEHGESWGSDPAESDPVNYFQEQEESWKWGLEDWQRVLWRVQLREYPGSVRLMPGEAFRKWCCDKHGNILQGNTLAAFANTPTRPGGVFYECGNYRGYRYGAEAAQYMSGF
jgi:hypothetical protein